VLRESYAQMIKMAGGKWVIISVNLAMILFSVCQIAIDYFTQQWAYAPA